MDLAGNPQMGDYSLRYPFFALVLALLLPPLTAAATRGRWYLARTSELPTDADELPCVVCGGRYHLADMATGPFHEGRICSLRCSAEGACRDACEPSPWRPPRGPVPLGMPGAAPPVPVPTPAATGGTPRPAARAAGHEAPQEAR
ncbi:hypothetical protein [Streptomyces hoynatensis]|uniref:Uncharacterized protein n=1 Tax=Streptomyces hoynatensis TaxID=1141874 RepID=A0A3A9YUY0_9ACTN|nr:hypothetical protein [Streptomyces hoynatensis]RKN39037.1 hypothetical protein D7294_22950 [Streptomyces hoynatensis]